MSFFRPKQWIIGRRALLILAILILGYRNYGDRIVPWFQGPNGRRDIVITRAEFRSDLGHERPIWIIGIRNTSPKFTYDQIELEASYADSAGGVIETDQIVVKQKISPMEEKVIGSYDVQARGRATRGTLRVLSAQVVQ